MTEDIKKEVQDNVRKARRRQKRIDGTIADGDFDFAIADLYYTCFYYLRALLLTRGTKYQTHKGTLIGFSKLFVKEGRASDKLSQFLEKLAAYRLEADYKSTEFSAADVAALLKKAEEFIAFAEGYLKKAME